MEPALLASRALEATRPKRLCIAWPELSQDLFYRPQKPPQPRFGHLVTSLPSEEPMERALTVSFDALAEGKRNRTRRQATISAAAGNGTLTSALALEEAIASQEQGGEDAVRTQFRERFTKYLCDVQSQYKVKDPTKLTGWYRLDSSTTPQLSELVYNSSNKARKTITTTAHLAKKGHLKKEDYHTAQTAVEAYRQLLEWESLNGSSTDRKERRKREKTEKKRSTDDDSRQERGSKGRHLRSLYSLPFMQLYGAWDSLPNRKEVTGEDSSLTPMPLPVDVTKPGCDPIPDGPIDPEHPRRLNPCSYVGVVDAMRRKSGITTQTDPEDKKRKKRLGCTDASFFTETKYDGERLLCVKKGPGDFTFYSRNMLPVPERKLSGVREAIDLAFGRDTPVVFDAELLSEHTQGSRNSVKRWELLGSSRPHYSSTSETDPETRIRLYIFDVLWVNGHSLMELPLGTRRQIQQSIVTPVPDLIDHVDFCRIDLPLDSRTEQEVQADRDLNSTDKIVQKVASRVALAARGGKLAGCDKAAKRLQQVLDSVILRELEGVVVKPVAAPYSLHGAHWVKLKEHYLPTSHSVLQQQALTGVNKALVDQFHKADCCRIEQELALAAAEEDEEEGKDA